MSEALIVDETIKRITSHKGCVGSVIVNADGIVLKSSFDNAVAVQYAALVTHLALKTRTVVRQLSRGKEEDDLRTIRVKSQKHEIIIVPEFDRLQGYTLIIVQQA